ncbi:AraC family transcriptional regulator [Niabella insulamsoli]|uniref:AraC family transcriptional regulator n=1 Tax=Niabella insulamsoli TaxID=3144874 RepID=UPI0031FDF488
MKIEYEIIKADPGSSFRLLHHKMVKSADFIWQFHYHPEYEIVFVPDGNGTRHVGNHLSTYRQGDLVMIGSNLPHAGFGLNATGWHEEVVLQLNPSNMPFRFNEMSALEKVLGRASYGLAFFGATKKEAGSMMLAMVNEKPLRRLILLLELFDLLAHSDEYVVLNKTIVSPNLLSKHKARLQKVFDFVEKNFQNPIPIQKIAEMVGLSVPSFCNFFKKTTQITFSEFVNQYRIQRACILLHQENNVSEVSYACGFNNVTYFNRLFKQIMNETPSDFRNKSLGLKATQ